MGVLNSHVVLWSLVYKMCWPQCLWFSAHEAEPTANDFLPAAILYGQVILHDDIKEFTQNGVVFVDGSKVEDIDVVVMATGYEVKFPFLEEEVLSVNENKVAIYS